MNWKLSKQTIFSNWEDPTAQPGDCWRCCIAAVLQVPAEEVPHFVGLNQGDADVQRWLNARGYGLVRFDHPDGYPFIYTPGFGGDPETEIPVIVVGPTIRSRSGQQCHSVVKVGMKVVYDPHPSEAGLLAEKFGYLIVKLAKPENT